MAEGLRTYEELYAEVERRTRLPECAWCRGEGAYHYKPRAYTTAIATTCPVCNGTGRINKEPDNG